MIHQSPPADSMVTAMTSVSSVVELTSDVNSAVERLKELGEQMRCGGHDFSRDDMGNITAIIAALRELDDRRQTVHEQLEAETITASVLRHRLATFPHKLKAELTAALTSARDSNAAQIQDLQSRLSEISEERSRLERKQEVLELHNEVLEPEQRKLKAQHNELVKKLNALMAKKAKMQITLNETRDKVKKTNDQITSLDIGMEKLREDMMREREEFATEKQALLTLLDNTRAKHKQQNEENHRLTRELETLQEDIVETKLEMDNKLKALHETEADIQRLLVLEEELKEKLQTGAQRTEELEKAGTETERETKRMGEEYATKRKEMEERTQQYKREVELVAAETKGLAGIKKGLRKDMKKAQGAQDMQALSLKDIQERDSEMSQTLQKAWAEEGARLEAENKELEFRLAQLLETHKVNVQLYKDTIKDLREKVAKEKHARETVEESYSDLQSQIHIHQEEHAQTMATLVTRVNEAKQQNQEMSDRTGELQEGIGCEDQAILSLEQQLRSVKTRLHSMTTSLTEQIHTLEQNITDLTEELCDRNDTLKEIEPACKRLEQEYKEENEQYETRKKEIIALKNKRAGLEDTIQRLQRELEKMHLPQDKLRMDTLRCRAYTRQRLKEQGREVEKMEGRVLSAHQQLTAITTENMRIEEASKHLQEESSRLQALFESSEEIEAKLDAELKKYRENLEEQWRENETLEERCSSRDKVVLKGITSLREASEERLHVISNIHEQFDQELQEFSDFLTTAARYRSEGDQS